jgi:hypothetical protein
VATPMLAGERKARRDLAKRDRLTATSSRDIKHLVWGTIMPIAVMLFMAWHLGGGSGGQQHTPDQRFG